MCWILILCARERESGWLLFIVQLQCSYLYNICSRLVARRRTIKYSLLLPPSMFVLCCCVAALFLLPNMTKERQHFRRMRFVAGCWTIYSSRWLSTIRYSIWDWLIQSDSESNKDRYQPWHIPFLRRWIIRTGGWVGGADFRFFLANIWMGILYTDSTTLKDFILCKEHHFCGEQQPEREPENHKITLNYIIL